MSAADATESLPAVAPQGRRAETESLKAVSMDTFRWIVSGLLGALVLAVGWFLNGIQADLRDVRKEVTAMRVEAAVVTAKLEDLVTESRRRQPR